MTEENKSIKLDIACGQRKPFGGTPPWVGIDYVKTECVDIVHDLFKFPWPIEDNSVEEAQCLPWWQEVTTPEGRVPICHIKSGDLVLGLSGFTKVRNVFHKNHALGLIRLKTANGFIEVTADHPVATPSGWLKADQLRKSSHVLSRSPKVKQADRIDGINVFSVVPGMPSPRPNGSRSIPERRSPLAELHQYNSLLLLGSQKRKALPKHVYGSFYSSFDAEMSGMFPSNAPRISSVGSVQIAVKSNSRHFENFRHGFYQDWIAISDHDLSLDLMLSDQEREGAFPVYNPSEVGPIGWSKIHEVCNLHFIDEVFNLETDDHTFFCGDILTHNCSHFIEHIPMPCACSNGDPDPLLRFFDELYRIMKDGAKCLIIAPYYSSHRCWQDPTHRRAISEHTFLYANKDWRKVNLLDHYKISCDFDFSYGYSLFPDTANRALETQSFWVAHYINAVQDIQVTLTKRPKKD